MTVTGTTIEFSNSVLLARQLSGHPHLYPKCISRRNQHLAVAVHRRKVDYLPVVTSFQDCDFRPLLNEEFYRAKKRQERNKSSSSNLIYEDAKRTYDKNEKVGRGRKRNPYASLINSEEKLFSNLGNQLRYICFLICRLVKPRVVPFCPARWSQVRSQEVCGASIVMLFNMISLILHQYMYKVENKRLSFMALGHEYFCFRALTYSFGTLPYRQRPVPGITQICTAHYTKNSEAFGLPTTFGFPQMYLSVHCLVSLRERLVFLGLNPTLLLIC